MVFIFIRRVGESVVRGSGVCLYCALCVNPENPLPYCWHLPMSVYCKHTYTGEDGAPVRGVLIHRSSSCVKAIWNVCDPSSGGVSSLPLVDLCHWVRSRWSAVQLRGPVKWMQQMLRHRLLLSPHPFISSDPSNLQTFSEWHDHL